MNRKKRRWKQVRSRQVNKYEYKIISSKINYFNLQPTHNWKILSHVWNIVFVKNNVTFAVRRNILPENFKKNHNRVRPKPNTWWNALGIHWWNMVVSPLSLFPPKHIILFIHFAKPHCANQKYTPPHYSTKLTFDRSPSDKINSTTKSINSPSNKMLKVGNHCADAQWAPLCRMKS